MAFNIFTTKRISCFGLHAFTPPDSNSGLVHFLFPGGFGHARLRHFFLDAGECRFAEFFFTLLLIHVPMPWESESELFIASPWISAAIRFHPTPCARRAAILFVSRILRGRPRRLPFVLAFRSPALTRSTISERSSSATAQRT